MTTTTRINLTTTLMVIITLLLAGGVVQAAKHDTPTVQGLIERCFEIAQSLPNDDEDYDPDINPFAQDVRSSQARILEEVAVLQAITGDVPQALKTLETIPDPSWRNPGWLKVVRIQAEGGDLVGAKETAMSTITSMWSLDTALGVIGLQYAAAGDLEKASAIFPDYGYGKAQHFLSISASQATAGDAKGAAKTYSEAVKHAEKEGTAISFRRSTLEHLISIQLRSEDWDGVIRSFGDLPENRKVFYVSSLAKAYMRQNNITAVRQLAEQWLQLSTTKKAGPDRDSIIVKVVEIYAMAGDIDAAIKQASSNKATSEGLLRLIAEVQARNQDIRGSYRTIGMMKDAESREAVILVIVKEQGARGDFKQAIQTVRSLKNPESRLQLLVDLSNISNASPHMSRMLDFMPPLQREGRLAWAAKSLAAAQARSGGAEEAMRWATQQSSYVEALALVGVARGLLGKTAD
ncbi:MAG: hypothetical protein OEY86_17100 [Nitrospira sp.]|nr:hypothetical protein [Nitrospira sp.]